MPYVKILLQSLTHSYSLFTLFQLYCSYLTISLSRVRSDDFKLKNKAVNEAFHLIINPDYRNSRKVYNYCEKEMDYNTTNLPKHLNRYKVYRDGKASVH